MFDKLVKCGYEVVFVSHAAAILEIDFPTAASELEEVLLNQTVPIEEIIGSGGGETKGTQRLRRGLVEKSWNTVTFTINKTINGEVRESISHKVDHVREFARDNLAPYRIALEIEWNNKDPFFDRDLENFKRLHAEGGISLGVIITRGTTLQNEMRSLVGRWVSENKISNFENLREHEVEQTARQRREVTKKTTRKRNPLSFAEAWTAHFVSDKFGQATTHWRKLDDRIRRGVGNPCPLVLIGLPSSIVTFGEDKATIKALLEAGADEINEGEE